MNQDIDAMRQIDSGNPAAVMTAATVGVLTVLLRELVKSGTLSAESFLAGMDELAATAQPVPQTPLENRMEQKLFDLVRLAVQSARQEARHE